MFANVYLNELDQYVKHELKIKYYYRYMDDAVFLLENKDYAKEVLLKVKTFLMENLKLELNQKTQIFKGKQGVNFCGYKINAHRMKLRDNGKRKLKDKIKYLKYEIRSGRMTSKDAKKYLAGHMGYVKYASKYNLMKKLFYMEDI